MRRSLARRSIAPWLLIAAACAPVAPTQDGGDGATPADAQSDTGVQTDTGAQTDAGVPDDTLMSDGGPNGPDAADAANAADGASSDAGDAGRADADGGGGIPTAFWQACTAASACAGENGACFRSFGTARCIQTCNTQADWTSCAGGQGICVPGTGEKLCLKRCGDVDSQLCGAGAACSYLGFRDGSSMDAGVVPVGVCVPECSTSGPDACNTPGRTCVASTRTCNETACPAGCPTGASCMGGECVPSPVAGLYGTCRTTTPPATNGCRSELCLGNATTGFCTSYCTTEDDAVCGAQGLCWLGAEGIDPPAMGSLPDRLISTFPTRFTTVGGRSKGICLKPCNDTGDCPSRWHCGTHSGRRVCLPVTLAEPAVMAGAGLPSSTCTANADCASGTCVTPAGSRFGICARSMGASCPAGTAEASAGSAICLRVCSSGTSNACAAGQVCGSDMRCRLGACRQNSDCASGFTCNVAAGACQAAPLTTGAGVGEPCTGDPSCASRTCLTMPTGGYCSLGCTVFDDYSDTCPAGSICNTNTIGASSICLDLCDNGVGVSRFGSCRTGYTCDPFSADRRFGVCVTR